MNHTIVAGPRERGGSWLADPGLGVYVHIPFCVHRCNYCDFNTYEGLDALIVPYVDALVADIGRRRGPGGPATSVFFGGGTPSLLETEQLARILNAVRERIGIAPGAEVTIECNPETVAEQSFDRLLTAGFNRFSIGIQSLAPHVLERLGRTHSAARALESIGAARSAGVEDINADLIYGSPWESDEDWVRSLDGVLDAAPDHVSAYALTVEEGTPLHTLVATGRLPDVDPDLQAARHAIAGDRLGAAGFVRYEVSNWSRPGRASRHNLLYWSAGDYLGFGAGAHAHVAGRRSWRVNRPRDFIAAVESGKTTEAGREELDATGRGPEALMLGLRLTSGIEIAGFERRFGRACLSERSEVLAELERGGLLERDGGYLRLTEAATMLANDVVCRLL